MDYLSSISNAIEFIERNLTENIDYGDVARHINYSNYHFHRMFSLITNVNPNEYIKNRKLSMAGQELSFSKARILDIALKYGYESPESFTKAFKKFHNITPLEAKKGNTQLKYYDRLIIQIKYIGGSIMDYSIISKPQFKVLCKVLSVDNEVMTDEEKNPIPAFWDKCKKEKVFSKLNEYCLEKDIYGLCGPISKESNTFNYGIGMKYEGDNIPEGYELWNVKPELWIVFKCKGEDGSSISKTWDYLFKQFLPTSEYEMLDDTDFELYKSNDKDCFCELWIPVKKK